MKAKDVMTTTVYTVDVETPIVAVARLLLERRISGAPVVDTQNRVLGVVSERDLMRRPESGTMRRHGWWLGLVASSDELAADYVKTHGSRVKDVMSQPAITIDEETDLADVARLLDRRGIKRVPVVRDGKLVGIISRANLLQGLIGRSDGQTTPATDAAIRARLLEELEREPWANLLMANVVVTNGVVHLWAVVHSEHERKAMVIAAESIPGVVRVEDHIAILAHAV
jgi:CBS domain-containing protein